MESGIRVRRARHGDLAGVRALVGIAGPATRADRKRFRHLVGTLREDCYVAQRRENDALLGVMVVAYVRGIDVPTASVRRLTTRSAEAVGPLLVRARALAAARHCGRLELQLPPDEARALGAALHEDGWADGPLTFVRSATP